MSIENYVIGAKQTANDAGTLARPDAEVARRSSLRKGKITSDNGVTCTVQLLDDMGRPINDADGNPVVVTRVPKFPPDDDDESCLLWIDAQGVMYVVNAKGGGGCSGGTLQGQRDLGWAGTRE